MRRISPIALVLLAPFVSRPGAAAGPAVKLHGLSHADFEKLPPNALLDVGGKTETKAQLLASMRPAASAKPAAVSLLDEAAAQIEREDKATASQANAAVLARVRAAPSTPLLAPAEPRITEVPYPTGPGYLILIFGSGFGRREGEVHLKFTEGVADLPLPVGVRLPADVARTLKADRIWADDQVITYVPEGLSGVVDQTAHLVVITKDGKRSAPAPVKFVAARQVRFLPAYLTRVIPDQGDCDRPGRHSIGCEYAVSNFFVWHVGADEVRPDPKPLKNGWKRHVTAYRGGLWGSMPGCHGVIGASSSTPTFDGPLAVSWIAECYVDYSVSYVVVGPRGTDPQ